jgi:hypothetical protein
MNENEQQPISPRARLQALRAIPERQRTDAEWDELNELEIKLASENREGVPQQHSRPNAPAPGGQPRPGGGGGGRPDHGKGQQQRRKFHQRPPKRNEPPNR